ncbi:hypothetical protein, partial [uncultured Chloroflexus sp.]|uniref:hypothetical protein n=1 Tax=uncultured Chloroflexus sp. TaxID=214040 RepID=UPI0026251454
WWAVGRMIVRGWGWWAVGRMIVRGWGWWAVGRMIVRGWDVGANNYSPLRPPPRRHDSPSVRRVVMIPHRFAASS